MRSRGVRWSAVVSVLAGALAGCSGKVERATLANGASCKVSADCASGSCVASRCAAGDGGYSSRMDGASVTPDGALDGGASTSPSGPDARHPTTQVDGSHPGPGDAASGFPDSSDHGMDAGRGTVPLGSECFVAPPAVCTWGQVSARDASRGWTVRRAMPLDGGDGLALEILHQFPLGAGQVLRVVASDATGGCSRPVSREKVNAGLEWALTRAATGGGVTAALVGCYYKFRCGAELHADDRFIANLEAETGADLYGAYGHEVAVSPGGAILAVSGPSGPSVGPLAADKLIVRSYPPGAAPALAVRTDFHQVLGGMVGTPDGGAALLLHDVADASPGASTVQRIDAAGQIHWQWVPGFPLDRVAATAGAVLVAGVPASGAGVTITALDDQAGNVRWQTSGVHPGAVVVGFGVGAAGSARLLVTAALDWGALVSLDPNTGSQVLEKSVGAPLLPGPVIGEPARFGVRSDGTAAVSILDRLALCADAP